jgi:transcriptional regulator with XRE-family HTH domain
MKITPELSDQALMEELGGRLAAIRKDRNLTQAELAEEAGISKRTLERLEAGAGAAQLSSFLRVCRQLGLLGRLDSLLPGPEPSPMDLLKLQGRRRQRASGKKAGGKGKGEWTWEDGK